MATKTKFKHIVLPSGLTAWVCESCLKGEHLSYGYDHRQKEEGRRDCKNIAYVNGQTRQCNCTQDWPELFDFIKSL
jgi:hypothetical protein